MRNKFYLSFFFFFLRVIIRGKGIHRKSYLVPYCLVLPLKSDSIYTDHPAVVLDCCLKI